MPHTHDLRPRLNAWLLHRAEAVMHRVYGPRKRAVFRDLPARVVEIGAGAGANLRYYRPGTRVTAVEPNPAMHAPLRAAAARQEVELEIRNLRGEALDLPDNSAQAVVGTLVLCSVNDPARVVAEIRRILAPGGRYIFMEHVAARPLSPLGRWQRLLHGPWQWLFDGCHLHRDTHITLQQAGFATLDMDCFVLSLPAMPFAPHIFGLARK
jgi:SAM-dependent methyltransferase